jgi:hypothetical protein
VLDRVLESELQQPELEQRADPGQVVEPAAGDLGTALHVDRAERFAQLQVVLDRAVERRDVADLAQHHEVVLTAGRCSVLDDVGYRQLGRAQRGLGPVHLGLCALDLPGQLLGASQQHRPLIPLRGGEQLAELVLLGTQRLEPGHRRAACLVGAEEGVNRRLGLAPGPLARPYPVRIIAQQSQINHDSPQYRAAGNGYGRSGRAK